MTITCPSCARQNLQSANFCAGCGGSLPNSGSSNTPPPNYPPPPPPNYPPPPPPNYPPPNYGYNQRPMEWKSEGTTLILTIILGIFGLGGIGHIYLGMIGRGILILVVGIILIVVTIATFFVGLIILIPFAIWVIYDARKNCKYYNDHLQQTGRPPW